jgi:nicotinamide phosphoribosyltransferase
METALLRAVWYPTTVATLSYSIKEIIKAYLEETSDNVEAQLPFKLHDFGARGTSSEESAMLGGMAHLVNFQGTDTLSGIIGARRYYNADMAGFSIPASEHSTMTSWQREGEADAYANMV